MLTFEGVLEPECVGANCQWLREFGSSDDCGRGQEEGAAAPDVLSNGSLSSLSLVSTFSKLNKSVNISVDGRFLKLLVMTLLVIKSN